MAITVTVSDQRRDTNIAMSLGPTVQKCKKVYIYRFVKKMLFRLQAQTLSKATPPIGKSNPVRKIYVTIEPLMQFFCLL